MVYEEVKNFFANIDCFLKCIYGDSEKEKHTEIQQNTTQHIEMNQNTKQNIEIAQNTKQNTDQNTEITYEVEIEPYIESEIDENNHIFTIKKDNLTYQVVGREGIKI